MQSLIGRAAAAMHERPRPGQPGEDQRLRQAHAAKRWHSDGLHVYPTLAYPLGEHVIGKAHTYSVEADNAELRHYLARFARRSRCFSRSLEAIKRAVCLFVHAWNARQLRKRRDPDYPCHLIDCLPTLS
jgi:hypothetical protein